MAFMSQFMIYFLSKVILKYFQAQNEYGGLTKFKVFLQK